MVKVGGSLLREPWLRDRLCELVQSRSGAIILLFPGGGASADVVREWQPVHQFNDDLAHHLAIEMLGVNARLLQAIWGRSLPLVTSIAELSSGVYVLDPRPLLDQLELQFPDEAPPHTWDVTSDSLAAWVACHVAANELILLKSVGLVNHCTSVDAVRRGWVDPYFPGIAGRLSEVSWCCLRDLPLTVHPWLHDGAVGTGH